MILALLLVAAPLQLAPDGTATARSMTQASICWWATLGKAHQPRPPAWNASDGWGWWSIYAKGEVTLDATDEFGWWGGTWPGEFADGVWVAPEPRVKSLTGLRDEPWRRHGLALRPWLSGNVLLCVRAGSAYVWGPSAVPEMAAGLMRTNFIPARACVSSDVTECR